MENLLSRLLRKVAPAPLTEKKVRSIVASQIAQSEKALRKQLSLITYNMQLLERLDSAEYALQNFQGVDQFPNKYKLLEKLVPECRPNGLFLEFGVYTGETARHIAKYVPQQSKLYAFDSFEGLPEGGAHHLKKGKFDRSGVLPQVPENVELVVGWYDETLPKFCKKHPETVSFIHVDCDIYPSTKTVFDCLGNQITDGTIICFDEFYNFRGWRDHEIKAFEEFIAGSGFEFEFVGWTDGRQAAVKIKGQRELPGASQ
jgi:predicted O-methyltransferase YrrM